MLIVAGEIVTTSEEGRSRYLAAVAPVVTQTLREAGCQTYAFSPDPTDSCLIRLYELWDHEASLAAHLASPHVAEWRTVQDSLPIISRSIHKYTISDVTPLG
jgi:quinol monooxygenase YgiN